MVKQTCFAYAKRTVMVFALASVLIANVWSHSAFAFDWVIEGKITTLEPSYMPGQIAFTMDVGAGSCPAGTWLWWANPDPENNKATYSTLLAAFLAGKSIRFHGFDTGCKGAHIHIF